MTDPNEVPVVLVTGATDGIGKETAVQLARYGAKVIVHGRNPEKVAAAVAEVKARGGAAWVGQALADLASLNAIREMVQTLQTDRLDVVINNAGVFMRERELSRDGFEMTFAVNYLAPFFLTHLLLPRLLESPSPRVINVSAPAHLRCRLDWDNLQGEKLFDDNQAYSVSKLAVVLFSVELARRLGSGRFAVNAVNPGVVSTKLLKEGFGVEGPDGLEKGAATAVHLALSDQGALVTGKYFSEGRPARCHPLAGDPLTASRFYEMTANLVGTAGLPRPRRVPPPHR